MDKIDYSNKFQLITKPTQSGKTFVVLSEIKKLFIENKDNNLKIINILFCDNSLLQTDQLKNRLEDSLYQIFTNNHGENSIILSSKSKTNNYSELFTSIFDDDCDNIITCANDIRISEINKLLNKQSTKDYVKFYIWIDESDKTFKNKNNILSDWEKLNNIEKITFITATPEIHFKNQFEEINVFQLESSYNCEKYQLFNRCNFEHFEEHSNYHNGNFMHNITFVLDNYEIKNSSIWFIPGKQKVISHNEIKKLVIEKGFYVFVINSTEKKLFDSKSNEIANLDDNENNDLSSKIALLYDKFDLKNKKVAITGNLCVNRGITISSNKVMITHAIFSDNYEDFNSAYQLVGRICGNFRKNLDFVTPTIYITKNMKNKILKMEDIAINLSKYEKITFDDFFKLKNGEDHSNKVEVEYREFKSFDKLKEFIIESKKDDYLKNIFKKGPLKSRFDEKNMENGFFKNTIRSVKKIYSKDEVIQNKSWGINNKNNCRYHVCYENTNDPSTILFIVVWLKEKIISTNFNGYPKDKPKGDPKDKPKGDPKGDPKDKSKGNPKGDPKNKPKGDPKDKPKGDPKGRPKGDPKDKPKDDPKGRPKDDPKGDLKGDPKGDLKDKPKGGPKGNPKGDPKDKPKGNFKKVRPKDINIFNSNTIIRHKTKSFIEYCIYIKNDKKLYRCNNNGIIDNNSDFFVSFNSFAIDNLKKYTIREKYTCNVYDTLEYYDIQESFFKKMNDIYGNILLN